MLPKRNLILVGVNMRFLFPLCWNILLTGQQLNYTIVLCNTKCNISTPWTAEIRDLFCWQSFEIVIILFVNRRCVFCVYLKFIIGTIDFLMSVGCYTVCTLQFMMIKIYLLCPWFTSQMPTSVSAGPAMNLGARNAILMWMPEIQLLKPSLLPRKDCIGRSQNWAWNPNVLTWASSLRLDTDSNF